MNNETLTDREVLLLRRKLDLLLRTGELLMASAADTNRIDRETCSGFHGDSGRKVTSGNPLDHDYGECE